MTFENSNSSLSFQFILQANFPFHRRKNKLLSDSAFAGMAIPFDNDYNNNAVPAQENLNNYRNNARNNIPMPVVHNNYGYVEERVGYLRQLLEELISVFEIMMNPPEQPQRQPQQPDMVPLNFNEVIGPARISGGEERRFQSRGSANSNNNGESGNQASRDARVGNNHDNQIPTGLPDIISCHLGASLEINHRPSRDQEVDHFQDELNNDEVGSGDRRRSSLGLKVQVSCSYGSIGRDLRHIADNYELQNDRRRRRRHPAERQTPPAFPSFQFEFSLTIAIPITIIGLGLAYFRRSS